jgi:MFS family permease
MHPRTILTIGNFFFSIFSALITFILLPFLSQFMPSAYAGFVVAGSSLVALILFPLLPHAVERFGAKQIALSFALIEMAALFALAAAPGFLTSILLIAVTIAVQPLLSYEFDLLLEATVDDNSTQGRVRTLFRTAWNIAGLAAPLLLGAILVNSNAYGHVFIAAAAMLAPIVVFFSANRLPRGPAPRYAHMQDTLVRIARNRDLAAVTFGNFCLYLFLAWAPLYTPIYLHNILGISWATLGWMFSVMLVPYVLIEYPAGLIADRFIGDKELMLAGFLIAGGGLAALALLTPHTSILSILIVLLVSRVGGALADAMVDAHFFRRVNKRDINSVSIFRGVWPLAYIVAPVIASLLLLYGSYPFFFLCTGGFIAVAGVCSTLLIKDFR